MYDQIIISLKDKNIRVEWMSLNKTGTRIVGTVGRDKRSKGLQENLNFHVSKNLKVNQNEVQWSLLLEDMGHDIGNQLVEVHRC